MANERPLRNPPIKEALVDLRIAADSAITAAALSSLREHLASDFPKVEERREFRAELRLEAGKILPPTGQDFGFNGLVFTSADGIRIAQFRKDGFTLNHLRPYPGADVLIAEGLRLWDLYRRLTSPVAVVRTALRYINQLELRYGPQDDFKRFLAVPAEMPTGTPQLVSGFLTRVVAHEPPDVVIVTQTLETTEDTSVVTLDIDAFLAENISVDSPNVEAVLRRLRTLKNRVFFGLLTDEALDLYA